MRVGTMKQTEGYRTKGVGELGNRVMGIKDGMCYVENGVLYATN